MHIWRRSYDVPPPNGESLKDTAERVLPYYEAKILPQIKAGKNVLLATGEQTLTVSKPLRGTRRVEVSQRNRTQPVGELIFLEYLFEHEFGSAVGIRRALGMVFRDGDYCRLPEGRGAGREYHHLDIVLRMGVNVSWQVLSLFQAFSLRAPYVYIEALLEVYPAEDILYFGFSFQPD